ERITLYKDLTEDIRALQKNQADAGVTIDQLTTTLAAIEAKLDEYNTRMSRLSERLDQTEMAMTERITSLSEQVNEIGRETTIIPGQPPGDRPPLSSDPASGVTPTDEPGSTLDPEASRFYHQAYTAYVNGDFDTAILGFQDYLARYPDTELTDIAQFWIAESYFSMGDYETALREYDKFISQYPESDKLPAAFLSKADAYLKLDRQIEAISHLKYIVNRFPDTPAAQKAADRLQALGE
ncbi:tol-pal system protein YbgF, partial [candidate division KSB3 bacterium]|nr:tol-pal system protein YbgF [candidate division KSB3 bacterium]